MGAHAPVQSNRITSELGKKCARSRHNVIFSPLRGEYEVPLGPSTVLCEPESSIDRTDAENPIHSIIQPDAKRATFLPQTTILADLPDYTSLKTNLSAIFSQSF